MFWASGILSAQLPSRPAAGGLQYSNRTLVNMATELCNRYTNTPPVYQNPSLGSGSTVPTHLPIIEQILLSIERYTALTGNELRVRNFFNFCIEYHNMANAVAHLGETSARTIKRLTENCFADERCMRERVYRADLEREIKNACRDKRDKLYGDAICQLVRSIADPPDDSAQKQAEESLREYCEEMYRRKFTPWECIPLTSAFDVISNKYNEARFRIDQGQLEIADAFSRGRGIIGSRICLETRSGRPPEEVPFYDEDCINYREEPQAINEEVLRQITALPYTQAFSPSSVLGYDGILDNVNTRVREGNLMDPNISSTFGSNVGAGGGTGGQRQPPINLADLEANYKKLQANIGVIIDLYDVARLAYASSTSPCRFLPVATRRSTINRIDSIKKTYQDYLKSLRAMWERAVARPREDHIALITRINFDLKDKYNQQEIDKVYDAVKQLLQSCIDARRGGQDR